MGIKLLLFSVTMATAQAQPWAGIIDSSRAIDWTATAPGSSLIDETRTQCGSTLMPSGGNDATQINAALVACGAHKYVLLGEGTFNITGGLVFGPTNSAVSYTTLRGSGPMKTILNFTSGYSCAGFISDICMINSAGVGGWFSNDPDVLPGGSNSYSWTAGYAKGTTVITLDRTTGLTASTATQPQILVLDQPNEDIGIVNTPNGASQSGTTVTITTNHPHGFSVGEHVSVDGVGTVNIASSANGGISESGSTVTVKTVADHNFAVGQKVYINCASVGGYSGLWVITSVPSSTTFTYENTTSDLALSGSGSVDAGYNSSINVPTNTFTITSVPTPTTFTYELPYSGLGASGSPLTGYPAGAAVDSGNLMVCYTGGLCHSQSGGSGSEGRLESGVYRSQQQHVKIVSISGNDVTISPGLYMSNWGTNGRTVANGRGPGAWYHGPVATGDAIENLTLIHTNSTNLKYGVQIDGCYDCWIKNVRSINAGNAHVNVQDSAHTTIMSSLFWGTGPTAHSGAYGIEERESGDDLYVNNIFLHIPSPILFGSTSATVVAYNYAEDNFYAVNPWMAAGLQLHDSGDHLTLWEGNQFPGFKADNIHGTHILGTLFRNYLRGRDANRFNGPTVESSTTGTFPVNLVGANGRGFNIIGNVLGTSGYHTRYQDSPGLASGSANTSIYLLGWGSTQDNCNFTLCDSAAAPTASTVSSLFRWGNYDTVNASARWMSSEVPSSVSSYGNAVPATQILPASLFLSRQPTWWTEAFGKLSIITHNLPKAASAVAYSTQLTASAGTAPYAWSITSGSLPIGLSLDASTGIISGTTAMPPQIVSFTVQVADSAANTDSVSLSLVITAAPSASAKTGNWRGTFK